MNRELMYIELKSGYADDGPAWIGYVMTSRSKMTVYFNDHAFQRYRGGNANYYDLETKEDYWISGVKKRGSNRHWAGHGKILIDRRAVDEYLALTGEAVLSKTEFDVIDMEDRFPVERIRQLLNGAAEQK